MAIKPGQKTVLITGCTPGGIGHALCVEFHARGLYVIATARNPAVIEDLAKAGITCRQLDVTKPDSIAACKKDVLELTGGKLDILVNNAGLTHTVPATDLDLDDVRKTFETNVFGVMAMVQAFVPLLIPTRGLIINFSSTASISPYVFGSAYCASKGAVNSYSRTLRQELRPFGIRVMVALPGTVKTNITQLPRALPSGSLYEMIADVYQWRLTFSKKTASMSPEAYAKKLAGDALKPEWPVWLRSWFGRPDWHYWGGMARPIWWASLLGEWTLDNVTYRMFRMEYFEKLLKEAAEKKMK